MKRLFQAAFVSFALLFLVVPSCSKQKIEEGPKEKPKTYDIGPAAVDSVAMNFNERSRILKVSVRGHLSDKCTSIYEDGFRKFREGDRFYLVIPTRRPENVVCAAVLAPFQREFSFYVPYGINYFDVWINGEIYKRKKPQ